MKDKSLKEIPSFRTDDEAEDFVENADLTNYDLSKFKPVKFEFEPKDEVINIRLSSSLLNSIKNKAKEKNIPYTRFIRLMLEQSISS